MPTRPLSPADAEIARLQAAHDAAEVAYTCALGRAYSLDLPEADEEAAFAALRAAGVTAKAVYLDLLAALAARLEGSAHTPIIPQLSPIRTNQEVPL